jgi:hypothetical protein
MNDMVKKGRHGNKQVQAKSYEEWLSTRPNKHKEDRCRKGHSFSDENTRIKIIGQRLVRVCRQCQYDTPRKDIVSYKVKCFVRGVENRKEIVAGLIDKIHQLGVKCMYCGGPFECLDHFVPKFLGGDISVENINPSCDNCNQRRKSLYV